MAGRSAQHVARLRAALAVLGVDWRPDAVADDHTRAVMLATALLGAAEAHLVGAELDAAEQASADIEALRSAYGPVRAEVVAAAVPDPENLDRLLLVLRTSLLLGDLGRRPARMSGTRTSRPWPRRGTRWPPRPPCSPTTSPRRSIPGRGARIPRVADAGVRAVRPGCRPPHPGSPRKAHRAGTDPRPGILPDRARRAAGAARP
ncbi:hypothetical protein [Kitasatospora sp. NPDC059327]|uniref:hypothetical protein n=1 Tax=Kitasatospora sp. NPDC059327 TaxID=3346803 RepID=UPI00368737F7